MATKNINFIPDNFLVMDSKLEKILESKSMEFPFRSSINFRLIAEHIKSVSENDNSIKKTFAESILKEFNSSPELHGAIDDVRILSKYDQLIDNMMMFLFPSAFFDKQTYAASAPYSDEMFYASPKFRNLIKVKDGQIEGELNIDQASYSFGKIISGYVHILSKYFKIFFNFDFPIIYKIIDPANGLDRYFKINGAAEFVDIINKGKLKKLSERDIADIKKKIYDLDYLKKILEPENFEFSGVYIMNVINITNTEIISAIKKELIEKDSITSLSGFLKLQHHLKSLLNSPDLLLGITDYSGKIDDIFKYGRKIGNSFLMNDNCLKNIHSIKGSVYEHSIMLRKAIIIDDLDTYSEKTKTEEEILKQGIRNLLVSPLILGDEIVGILEIGTPVPGQINMINSLKLREILPLFAIAIERSREDIKNRIRNIIKEKCTAIHPTLEWKFQKAAINYLNNESKGIQTEMEEIVFNDVYPLYGMSDIRNSSLQRNEAIRDDLIQNLEIAKKVIVTAMKHKKLKIFNEFIFRMDKKINSLKFGIFTGDEAEIMKFLSREIVPLFEHIKDYNDEVGTAIKKYHDSLDNELMVIYNRRKSYEESATKINSVIVNYLDEQQIKIQEIFPHYFERYKTDGVDHSIYIGASLTENNKFDRIYLKNIRLWQLMMMCGIVRKTEEIKNQLSIPLDTAHLILVQDSPLSVKFRYDEKKFDVDGAYNIRYEIMKKRIDKAEVKGRGERLTQPGKIAIVFSQNSEAQEYLEYIEYLQSLNFLRNEIEELDIEDLQGIAGLKALRVEVDTEKVIFGGKADTENLKEVVKKMKN